MSTRTFELDGRSVEVGNAGKVLFPDIGLTEGDLAGYYARVAEPIPPEVWLNATVQLGLHEISRLTVQAVQETDLDDQHYCGFRIGEPDLVWRKFVSALYEGHTHGDLDQATQFLA